MYMKQRSAEIVLTMLFVSMSVFSSTHTARAQGIPSFDAANLIPNNLSAFSEIMQEIDSAAGKLKEYGLDKIASTIAKNMIKDMSGSVLNWANTGYGGDPFFVKDQNSFFKSIGDQEVIKYITEMDTLNQNNRSPYAKEVSQALIEGYVAENNPGPRGAFTLDKVIGPNWQEYDQDFSAGGWDGWLAVAGNPSNNPFGTYLEESERLQRQIAEKKAQQKDELVQQGGLLSQKECVKPSNASDPVTGDSLCNQYSTVTPGAVIKQQLTDTLSSPQRQMENADEFGEIVSTALTTMIQDLAYKGLGSLGNSSSSGTGSSLTTGGPGVNNTILTSQNIFSDWYKKPDQLVDLANDVPDALSFTTKEGAIYGNIYMKSRTIPAKLMALDKCLPGPDKGWEARYRADLNEKLNKLDNNALAQLLKGLFDLIPGFGSATDFLKKTEEELRDSIRDTSENMIEKVQTDMVKNNIPSASQILNLVDRSDEFNRMGKQAKNKLKDRTSAADSLTEIKNAFNPTADEATLSPLRKRLIALGETGSSESTVDQAQIQLDNLDRDIQKIDSLTQKCAVEVASSPSYGSNFTKDLITPTLPTSAIFGDFNILSTYSIFDSRLSDYQDKSTQTVQQ